MDTAIRLLFGRIEMKANIVSLYNALECTDYTVDTELEITTLEDAIYIKMKNDVSLLIDSNLALWEQQSSYNPNMPLRGLMYFGNLYDSYIDKNNLNKGKNEDLLSKCKPLANYMTLVNYIKENQAKGLPV